jgi:hypothetical protein
MKLARNSSDVSRRIFFASALAVASTPRVGMPQTPPGASMPKIECAFDKHRFTATLFDNPTALDLLSMLPLEVTIEDYADNEKIARLPRKLTEDGSGSFGNEAPGDLCYYAPWGNLAFFYAGYRYSQGLIRLGRLDSGFQPLLTRGRFPLRIARAN